tara:strand:+ start:28 stop:1167 length:1140 start_codon:yes stop_codon:yes gene_type:complete
MSKIGIIRDFKTLAKLFKKARKTSSGDLLPGRDPRRQTAYQNAASAICVLPGEQIRSILVIKKGQLRPDRKTKAVKREVYITTNKKSNIRVPSGLGKATSDKISEYINTGKIKAAEQARKWLADNNTVKNLTEKQSILKDFEGIFNVGTKTSKVWLKHYLKIPAKIRPKPLTWVKQNKYKMPNKDGKFKPLTHAQFIGLKYYKDLQKRIPRHYIHIVELMIKFILIKKFGKRSFKLEAAGSYRRGEEDSGDIDIIITSSKLNLKDIVDALSNAGIVVATMSMDKNKFTGVCHCPSGQWFHFHLDLVFTSRKCWDAALLWFTGSKGFNTKIRNIAKKQGFILNQYGLFKQGAKNREHPIALKEKDIFKVLGEPYISPECR